MIYSMSLHNNYDLSADCLQHAASLVWGGPSVSDRVHPERSGGGCAVGRLHALLCRDRGGHSHPAVVGGHTRAALPRRGSGSSDRDAGPFWGLHGDGLARPRMPGVSSHPDPTPCLPVSRCAGLHVSHHGVGQRGLPVSVQILQRSNCL